MEKPKINKEKIQAFLKTDKAILMICIGIAFVFWLFTKLSYEYNSMIVLPVSYNCPEGQTFTRAPEKRLELSIEGSGWDLLGLHWKSNIKPLALSVGENEQRTINSSSLKNKIGRRFSSSIQISHIYPENIQLKTEELVEKTVPLILDAQIDLAPLHQLKDSLQINPAQVNIKGPASIVRDINEWHTTPLIRQEVQSSFEQELPLKSYKDNIVVFDPKEVACKVQVEQITEKELEVPIEILNAPDSLLLVLLPKTIKIKSIVGLSDYKRLRSSEFQAVVDFKSVDIYQRKKIRISLLKVPNYIRQFQFSPKKADYIIRSRQG